MNENMMDEPINEIIDDSEKVYMITFLEGPTRRIVVDSKFKDVTPKHATSIRVVDQCVSISLMSLENNFFGSCHYYLIEALTFQDQFAFELWKLEHNKEVQ